MWLARSPPPNTPAPASGLGIQSCYRMRLRSCSPAGSSQIRNSSNAAGPPRAAGLREDPLMLPFPTAARTILGDQDAVSVADRLPSEVLPTAADHAAHDPGTLAAIAVTAAARGDHRLALDILSAIT